MHTRTVRLIAPMLLLLAFPVATWAQDASTVLAAVQKTIGKQLPPTLQITAAGSGYRPGKTAKDQREHYRIASYTANLNFTSGTGTTDSPWPPQAIIWTTPFGFLEGAMARSATVAPETVAGTKYQVVTFTTASGQQVKGYVTDKNVLERTRTELQDPKQGKIQYEVVYLDWMDFNGLKFPSTIIQKENGQVARILIVQKVEAGPAAAATAKATS
jgi:hypothetical protein